VSQRAQTIRDYHEATKHRFRRYAAGPRTLDWANQPAPFRAYTGADAVKLPLVDPTATAGGPGWESLATPAAAEPGALSIGSVSDVLFHSLAVSCWKRDGDTVWALRCNPSSGNLHPIEAYIVVGPIDGLGAKPAIYHYDVRQHALELRAELAGEAKEALAAVLPEGGFHVGLTVVPWRQAWKYGERGLRYCHLDVGHACGAVAVAAARIGWAARLWLAPSTEELAALLGSSDPGPAEPELPAALIAVTPSPVVAAPPLWRSLDSQDLAALSWRGRPSSLSRHVRPWPLSTTAASALEKPATPNILADEPAAPAAKTPMPPLGSGALGTLARRRRSAQRFDATTVLARDRFYALLSTLQPAGGCAPWPVVPWHPRVDLVLFVHRVDGLEPGRYVLVRDPSRFERLRADLRPEYTWNKPRNCPGDLPLYRLEGGDQEHVARMLACVQDLAADGCFTAAMLADFETSLRRFGSWFYSCLHWECGVLGQLLYLGSEALGLSGCGLGCYFDDAVHQLLGLPKGPKAAFQCLYQFAVGAATDDADVETLPAYPPPTAS
jgi:SagB-type dehydrogenase family enzyme